MSSVQQLNKAGIVPAAIAIADAKEICGGVYSHRSIRSVWERDRIERLFGMQYTIEMYTPMPNRVYGYCVCPSSEIVLSHAAMSKPNRARRR